MVNLYIEKVEYFINTACLESDLHAFQRAHLLQGHLKAWDSMSEQRCQSAEGHLEVPAWVVQNHQTQVSL